MEPKLRVLYGVIGEEGERVARDPTGYLALDEGIYRRHGLEVSWDHVQGTDERLQSLVDGEAHLSLVIGRASLRHFLESGSTRVIGSCMNRSPYLLVAPPEVHGVPDLRGKSLACRGSVAATAPLAETLLDRGRLAAGGDVSIEPVDTDQHALDRLSEGAAGAALLPRPFDFVALERGFAPVPDWPEVAADPLPITIETTASLLAERGEAMSAFLTAHREGIRCLKERRSETLAMLRRVFGYAPALAATLYDDYLTTLDEGLAIDPSQVEKLVRLTAPDARVTVPELASRWLAPWAAGG